MPDEDKPKLRGGDTTADAAENKAQAPRDKKAAEKEKEKAAAAAKEKEKAAAAAKAKAASKAKAAAEKAAALAKPQNGSIVMADTAEFVDSERLHALIAKAVRGGSAADAEALRMAVLAAMGGQWVNSLVLCKVVASANGSVTKVPILVANLSVYV